MRIAGSVFLVTGGSSGLGAACTRMLAAGGGRVVVADVNEVAGNTLAGELGDFARFARTDVTEEASVRAALATAASLGPLRGVIQCAGIITGERVLGKAGPHPLD